MKSSLALQLLLYLGSYYCGAFLIIEFLLIIYKSIILPYPAGNLLSECLLLVMLCCVEVCRVLSGWKGNLLENTSSIIVSLALLIPSVLSVVYILAFQSYVLRLETILCCVQLAIQGLQLVFGLVCAATFSRGGY